MSGAPEYVRFTLRCRPPDAAAAVAALLDLPTPGWQELTSGEGLVFWLSTAALDDGSVAAALERLQALGELEAALETGDWERRWRRFHQPVRVDRVLVRPPWAQPDPEALDVLIEMGMAFGTGAHHTTRQCLRLLQMIEPGSLLDVGCGTGVLSVAAVRLGYRPVHAIDNDELATSAAAANALLNGVSVGLVCADATDPTVELPRADVAVANLALRPIVALGRRLGAVAVALPAAGPSASRPAPAGPSASGVSAAAAGTGRPRDVILAGLLATQVDEATAAWPAYAVFERLHDEEWWALHLRPATSSAPDGSVG